MQEKWKILCTNRQIRELYIFELMHATKVSCNLVFIGNTNMLISIPLHCAARWEVSPLKCAQPHSTQSTIGHALMLYTSYRVRAVATIGAWGPGPHHQSVCPPPHQWSWVQYSSLIATSTEWTLLLLRQNVFVRVAFYRRVHTSLDKILTEVLNNHSIHAVHVASKAIIIFSFQIWIKYGIMYCHTLDG